MSAFDFFDKIYYINLLSRKDRMDSLQKQFNSAGITKAERTEGTIIREYSDNNKNASIGNHTSHAHCIIKARDAGAKNCLIFEDDVEFFYGGKELNEYLENSINSLPKDWALFYLGINMDAFLAHRVTPSLAKLDGGFTTHAYAINAYMFDTIMKINLDMNTIHNDVSYSQDIMPKYPCFVTIPLLAGQLTNYSDIQGRVIDSNSMFKQRFKNNLR